MVLSPGHIPNWDMVADMVNNVSRIYRGPKQCRIRYENHIVPREEGKIIYDTNPKKQKKTKSMYKLPPQTKTNRPMRTSQLYMQDNNSTYTHLYIQRFETIKNVSNKRTPTVKPLLVNPSLRNPKHAAVLAECGIIYDQPLTPIEVATRRAERIAKEKKTAQTPAVLSAEQQQLVAQRLQQQAAAKSAAASPAVAQVSAPAAASPGTTTPTPVPSSTSQTVVVGLSQAQVNAASTQQIGTVVSVSGTTVIPTGSVATLSPALSRVQRPVTTLTVQDVVAGGQVRAVSNAQTVVSVASLTPAQVQVAAQRLANANLVSQAQTVVTGVTTKGLRFEIAAMLSAERDNGAVTAASVTVGGKTLTPAQLHYYKQHQIARQQQQQQQRLLLREQQQLKVIQAQTAAGQSNQKVSVAVTTGTPMGIATVAGVTAVQVSPAQQQRAQFFKQGIPGSKQTIARAMSESEMAALIKRQQQQQLAVQQQQKAGGTQVAQVQVPAQTALTPAQILAQAGLQVQPAGTSGQTQVATLVKTVSAPGTAGTSQSVTIPVTSMTIPPQVKATLAPGSMKTGTPHQIRHLALHQQLVQQRKLPPQKMAQLTQVAGKAGVPAQLIVQSQKAMPTTMTVQQIQQVIKHVQPQAVQHIAHVVTASPGVRTSVPNVTIDSAGRPQVSVASTLASALAGTIKVAPSSSAQQQALLSQVNAVLQQQGQPMSVAVRQAQSPVRIQTSAAGTPLVAVTVQQPTGSQSQGVPAVVTTQQSNSSQETDHECGRENSGFLTELTDVMSEGVTQDLWKMFQISMFCVPYHKSNMAEVELTKALRDLPVRIQTASKKERNALLQNVVAVLSNPGYTSVNGIIRGICKVLQLALPRYRDSTSQYYVRKLIIALVKQHGDWTMKHLTATLSDIASAHKNLVPTNNTSQSGLFALTWSCLLIEHGLNNCSDNAKAEFQRLVETQAILLSVVLAVENKKSDRAYRILTSMWKSVKGSEELYGNAITNSEPSTQIVVFGSYLIRYLTETKRTDLINKYKVTLLEMFIKIAISCKTKPAVYIIKESEALLKHVSHDEFKQQLLPAMQKAMLRNPEIILECVGHVMSELSLDLSQYAQDIGKSIAANLHSKEDLAREESIAACRNLASQCSDASALEVLLQHLFDVFHGSEGKLTVATHKMSVLQGAGNLSYNAVTGSSVQRLASVAADHFIKVLDVEVHEKTLIQALEMLSLWCAKFSNEVPKKLMDWLKKGPGLKTSTAAVRTSYIECMSACFHGNTLPQGVELVPLLLKTIEKAVSQPAQ
ncbi:hypothetical protein L9F63_013117, partial [Diploptera punctata]